MSVEVPQMRSTIADTPFGFEIVIPAKRSLFAAAFLGAWLIGWAFGEISVARSLFFEPRGSHSPELFRLAWLCGWTVGGAFALYAFLWNVAGRERITLNAATLSVRWEAPGVGRTRDFDLGFVSNVRAGMPDVKAYDALWATKIRGADGGKIAFDYGAKTIRFGGSLDEAEARLIVDELRKRHNFPMTVPERGGT